MQLLVYELNTAAHAFYARLHAANVSARDGVALYELDTKAMTALLDASTA